MPLPSLSTPIGNTGISVDPSKAARTALLVAKNTGRLHFDAGGQALKQAINNFSQARNAEFGKSTPSAGTDQQLLQAMLWPQEHQLAIAEAPHVEQQPMAQNMGDLGDEIERGAKFLKGEPADDDERPTEKEATVNTAVGHQIGNAPPIVSGVHVHGVQNGNAPPLVTTKSFESPQPFGDSGPDSLVDRTKYGIAGVESSGWKNPYAAIGPVLKNGDRAYGKYQVMGSNIPAWTKEALGTALTPAQFYRDPDAQEKTASYQIGKILDANGGDPHQAASVWFTGRRLEDVNPNASDGYTTNREYQRRFSNGFNSYPQPSESAQNAAPVTPVETQPLPSQPQTAPAAQPNDASAGPQAQADPMSNLYDKIAFSPDVQAGYDNPQVLFDPNAVPSAARGGKIKRAPGGSIYSMPTNELIDKALRIINRHKAADGGTQTTPTLQSLQAQYNTLQSQLAKQQAAQQTMLNAQGLTATRQMIANEQTGQRGGTSGATPYPDARYMMDAVINARNPTPATQSQATPQATTPNTPAVPNGQVGNQGTPNGAGINDAPTSGPLSYDPANPSITGPTSPIPMASPTPFNGYNYNNTLDQVLGTNNPTQNQIFGFNYPTNLPAPKPQPVGPVSQNEINGLYGFGGGSQMGTGTFQSGGAVIMDAMNRARKASGGRTLSAADMAAVLQNLPDHDGAHRGYYDDSSKSASDYVPITSNDRVSGYDQWFNNPPEPDSNWSRQDSDYRSYPSLNEQAIRRGGEVKGKR